MLGIVGPSVSVETCCRISSGSNLKNLYVPSCSVVYGIEGKISQLDENEGDLLEVNDD